MIEFRPSAEAQRMIAPEDKQELDYFLELEHILRMARAKARQIWSQRPAASAFGASTA